MMLFLINIILFVTWRLEKNICCFFCELERIIYYFNFIVLTFYFAYFLNRVEQKRIKLELNEPNKRTNRDTRKESKDIIEGFLQQTCFLPSHMLRALADAIKYLLTVKGYKYALPSKCTTTQLNNTLVIYKGNLVQTVI